LHAGFRGGSTRQGQAGESKKTVGAGKLHLAGEKKKKKRFRGSRELANQVREEAKKRGAQKGKWAVVGRWLSQTPVRFVRLGRRKASQRVLT